MHIQSGHYYIAISVWPWLVSGHRVHQFPPDLGPNLGMRVRAHDVQQRVLLVRRQVGGVPEREHSQWRTSDERSLERLPLTEDEKRLVP